MKKSKQEHWNELQRAVKPLFKNTGDYSKKIEIQFSEQPSGVEGEMGIYTEDIDNHYDEEGISRWEIILNKDGTWKIS